MRAWLVLAGFLVCMVLLATQVALPERTTDLSAFPLFTDAELADRIVVDFSEPQDGIVSYAYLTSTVPLVLADNELPQLRTENSFTTLVGQPKTGDETLTLNTVFYAQPAYAQDADGTWKYLEYATTTEQAFRNRDMTIGKYLTELLVRSAYADTLSPFSGAGDGYVEGSAGDATEGCTSVWGTETDSDGDSIGVTGYIKAQQRTAAACSSIRTQFYVPFDTSAIASGSTITAATLNVYVVSKTNTVDDGTDYITLVRTSQSTHTSLLAFGDYGTVGTTEGIDSGQRKDITSVSTSAYSTFTLNSTGRGWIAVSGQASNCSGTSGITCIGLREGHDNTGSEPTSSIFGNQVTFSTSEESGTAQDPYLSVTYTAPPQAVLSGGVWMGGGGRLNVVGGKVQIN